MKGKIWTDYTILMCPMIATVLTEWTLEISTCLSQKLYILSCNSCKQMTNLFYVFTSTKCSPSFPPEQEIVPQLCALYLPVVLLPETSRSFDHHTWSCVCCVTKWLPIILVIKLLSHVSVCNLEYLPTSWKETLIKNGILTHHTL